jgi:hypothetical protein
VASIGAGVLPLAAGLLLAVPGLVWVGGGLVVVGLGAHVVSLVGSVRHRRRALELLHAFLFTSTAFLVAAVVFGVIAATADVSAATRATLVSAEVGAFMGWLTLAIVGHSHKIVPFIVYTRMRARGVRLHRSGRPLLFGDLYRKTPARVTLAATAGGFLAIVSGLATASSEGIAVGGVLVATGGLIALLNLGLGPKGAGSADPAPPTSSSISEKGASNG